MVTLRYVLYSAEGNAERVRLRMDAPAEWLWTNEGQEHRDRLLEPWEIVRGEVHIRAPSEAPIGSYQLVRLTAEIVGEPGAAEALMHVQVLNAGRLNVGAVHLAGTVGLNWPDLEPSGFGGSRVATAVDLSGRLGPGSSMSLSYRQGPQENRSNHQHVLEDRFFRTTLRHDSWDLEIGTRVPSPGTVLTGPTVDGRGVALRRTSGRLIGEVVMAQPTTFSGAAAGHLLRSNFGINTTAGTIALALSDFERPDGGYTTLPPSLDPTLDPDSLEELERELELSRATASTRVRGVGVESSLRFAGAHRLVLRGGTLRLANAEGDAVRDRSAEAQYYYSGSQGSFSTRWRRTPPTVEGVYIPGSELAADGALRLTSALRVVARAYQYDHETLGESRYFTETQGRSLGLSYAGPLWRFDVHGHRREVQASASSLRRSVQLSAGRPLGALSLNMNAEVGREHSARGEHPFRWYRGDLRWRDQRGHASLVLSSHEAGDSPARMRGDLLGSVIVAGLELAGGAWVTRGWSDEHGLWLSIGVPVTDQFMLDVGVRHARQPYGVDAPDWRFAIGLRRKLIVPLPFLGDGIGSPTSAADSVAIE
jgi:hypothetical protein